jgi:hypothetical protein
MSGEINVVSRTQTIVVDPVSSSVSIINAGPAGPGGPAGTPGTWVQVTQAQYDALNPPNPTTLYVIIG